MGININTRRLLRILEVTPASQNIMLVGKHGIGKSEILTRFYQQKGMKVVVLFLGQMADPGDLIGLPQQADNRTHFVPPFWWPDDNQPIVLFLDELNRARPELLQTNHLSYAEDDYCQAVGLPYVNEGDEYQLTHLDPALVSRFNVYNFCPTVQEWLQWAEEEKLDPRVVRFISLEGHWLDGMEGQAGIDTGFDKTPDRRAWKRVSDAILPYPDLAEEDIDLLAGMVGPQAASRFMGSLTGHAILTGAEVLQHFEQHEATLRKYLLHQLAMVNESVFRHLEVAGSDAPAEYALNLNRYLDLLGDMQSKEAIAHLANLFESGSYPKAVLFISEKAPQVAQKLMTFIAEL